MRVFVPCIQDSDEKALGVDLETVSCERPHKALEMRLAICVRSSRLERNCKTAKRVSDYSNSVSNR